MKLTLAAIAAARSKPKSDAATQLAADYIARAGRYAPCAAEYFPSESALLAALDKPARAKAVLALFDLRGRQLTSQEFAAQLGRLRDSGAQQVVFAIGPHDGWTATAHARADLAISLGRMTLPHELARAVAAEQIYRALTILAGHPYHSGH